MAKRPRVIVTQESNSGRNLGFKDTRTGETMTRATFVREIKHGNYDNYHVRMVNGVATPASNPNGSESDNLG